MDSNIKIKWAYEPPAPSDGARIFVDRLWPRGVLKEQLDIIYWARSVSPSSNLRKWYGHDRKKWEEFRARYFPELSANPEGLHELADHLQLGTVAFLYSSKEPEINNEVALRDYLKHQ